MPKSGTEEERPDPEKLLQELDQFCAEGSVKKAEAVGRLLSDSGLPVSRLARLIVSAVASGNRAYLAAARIIFYTIIKDDGRRRAIQMPDALMLGRGQVGEALSNEDEPIALFWQEVIYPRFDEWPVGHQLTMFEIAYRDNVTHDVEWYWMIGLIAKIKIAVSSRADKLRNGDTGPAAAKLEPRRAVIAVLDANSRCLRCVGADGTQMKFRHPSGWLFFTFIV